MQVHDRPQGAPVLALAGDSVSVKRMQNHAPMHAWLLYVKMAGFSGNADQLRIGCPVVTLAMARETRTKYRRLLWQGIDPRQHLAGIAEEKRIQNECTLEKVAEQWLKEKKRTSDLSEDHAKDVWRSLEMHVFPSLGNTPVTEIRPKMLKEHLTPLEEQGILETLRRVISRLTEIFRFAISEELIEFNPADNLVARFKKPKKQNMPALHPSDLGRLMLALQNASIRMKKAEWHILNTFMKMNRSHTMPLRKQALRVLMEPSAPSPVPARQTHRPAVFLRR